MKKIFVLAGFAAVLFGMRKLMSGKQEESLEFGDNGYAPQPQG